jgi:flagellar basal-body rod protein FlgG
MAVRALTTAASGMNAMQTKVDVIANNLSNVSTTGYKRDRADFQDLLYQHMRRPGIMTPLQNRTPVGIQVGLGVKLSGVSKEFEQGTPVRTGNMLDMAVVGEGFFQIELQGGQIAYTRDGTFHRDSDGSVVTSEGYRMFPNIVLADDVVRVETSVDGVMTFFNAENQEQGQAQIELARFPNPQGLEAIGDNLYVAREEATGAVQVGNPADPGFGVIRQRFLEGSNVDVVNSMVDLIKSQRAYEFNANAIRSSDQMLQQAANLVR